MSSPATPGSRSRNTKPKGLLELTGESRVAVLPDVVGVPLPTVLRPLDAVIYNCPPKIPVTRVLAIVDETSVLVPELPYVT